jgi:hypothetical protein
MNNRYILFAIVFVILSIFIFDRLHINSEQQKFKTYNYNQEKKFYNAEKFLDSLSDNICNIKAENQIDTVFVHITEKIKEKIKITDSTTKFEEETYVIKSMSIDNSVQTYYENQIFYLQNEIQRLNNIVDSLQTEK